MGTTTRFILMFVCLLIGYIIEMVKIGWYMRMIIDHGY